MSTISIDAVAYNITLQYLTYKLVLNPTETTTKHNALATTEIAKLMNDYVQEQYYGNDTDKNNPPSVNFFMFRTDSEPCYEYKFNNVMMKQSKDFNSVRYSFMIFACGFINVLDYFGSDSNYFKCDQPNLYLYGAVFSVNKPFKSFPTSAECINFLSKENAKNPNKISRFCCIETNKSFAIRHRTLQLSNKNTNQCYAEEVTFCIDKYSNT